MNNENERDPELFPSVCPRVLILFTDGVINVIESEGCPIEVLIATRTTDGQGNTTSLAYGCFESTVNDDAVVHAFDSVEAWAER
jgi:hypothetical protein